MEPLFPFRTVRHFSPHPTNLLTLFLFSSKLGPRLKVVALIDPAIERAQSVLQKKCESFVVSAYKDTRIYKSLDDFIKHMTPRERPRAIIIGSPPMFRGSTAPGRNVEMQILEHFPGVALFIEKPVATGPVSELQDLRSVAQMIDKSRTVCSVGWVFEAGFRVAYMHLMDSRNRTRYMLRYLKAVQMMKQIIEEKNLKVMCTVARYACAYEKIAKPDWWDKSRRYVIFLNLKLKSHT